MVCITTRLGIMYDAALGWFVSNDGRNNRLTCRDLDVTKSQDPTKHLEAGSMYFESKDRAEFELDFPNLYNL
ncbi:hypothetical protein [Leptospira vanthielii]|uniref:Uncharacterized protein n=1 Tax=Leptospira vanthielii TaxID=293085 RepID=A0ABY2NQ33_9LEPT|nr:hypothetical protein [Leptospira vanthielii]TGM56885.1 hypothetical protein EHQ95_09635 [Leptospira vanthielii]